MNFSINFGTNLEIYFVALILVVNFSWDFFLPKSKYIFILVVNFSWDIFFYRNRNVFLTVFWEPFGSRPGAAPISD